MCIKDRIINNADRHLSQIFGRPKDPSFCNPVYSKSLGEDEPLPEVSYGEAREAILETGLTYAEVLDAYQEAMNDACADDSDDGQDSDG